MLIIDRKVLTYDIKEVHFSDYPYDIEGCDFLHFNCCKNKIDTKDFTCKNEITSVIDLTENLDTIWQKMDNKSVRYNIRKAEKENIEIRVNECYDEFFQMYKSFIKKKGFSSLYDVFGAGYTKLETMKRYGTLFVAEYNGEIICGNLLLEDNDNIKSWIKASKHLDLDKAMASIACNVDRLIDWNVIKYAKEKGIKEFDLGGLWSEEELKKDEKKKGINNYKLKMSGKIVTLYSYEKIYSKMFYLAYHLYKKSY